MTLRPFLLGVPALLAVSVETVARAVPMIVNGNFEQTTLTRPNSAQMTTTNVTGWSTTGYSFLFLPAIANTTGAKPTSYSRLHLGGSTTVGTSHHFPATSAASDNCVTADGAR